MEKVTPILYMWICEEERHHQADTAWCSMEGERRVNCMKKVLFSLKSSLEEDFHSDGFTSNFFNF